MASKTLRLTLQKAAILVIAAVLSARVAEAQDGAGTEAPTIESIQAAQQRLQSDATIPQDVRDRAAEIYSEAVEQLRSAQAAALSAASSEETARTGAQQIGALQAQLAEPPESPDTSGATDMSLVELDIKAAEAETQLALAKSALEQLEREQDARTQRLKELPRLQIDAQKVLSDAETQGAAAAAPGDQPAITEAKSALARARALAAKNQLQALVNESVSYNVRGRILSQQILLAQRNVAAAEKAVDAWQDIVSTRRTEEAEKAAAKAQETLLQSVNVPKAVQDYAKELAQENSRLAQQRAALSAKTQAVSVRRDDVQEKLDQLQSEFDSVQKQIAAAGLNTSTGLLLRKLKANLPAIRQHERNVRERQELTGGAEAEVLHLQDEIAKLSDVDGVVEDYLAGIPSSATEKQQETLEAQHEKMARVLRNLLFEKKEGLSGLRDEEDRYLQQLVALDSVERRLIENAHEVGDYVAERILWIRSSGPLSPQDVRPALAAASWLAGMSRLETEGDSAAELLPWEESVHAFWRDFLHGPASYFVVAFVLVMLIALRRRLLAHLRGAGEAASSKHCTSFVYTFAALVYTLLLAVVLPALLLFAGWRLGQSLASGPSARAFGAGFTSAAIVCLIAGVPRQILLRGGLAEKHFNWPDTARYRVRRHLTWLLFVIMPSAFVITALANQENEAWFESFGRAVFIIAMAALAVFGHILMHPRSGALQGILRVRQSGDRRWVRRLYYFAAAGIPAVLAAMACAGYFYTASRLSWRLFLSVAFAVVVLLCYGLFMRWLMLARRRLAIDQARKRREMLKAKEAEEETREEEAEEGVDLAKVDVQTQRLTRSVVVFTLVVGLWLIWADVLPALGVFRKVELWSTTQVVTEEMAGPDGSITKEKVEKVMPVTLAHLGLALIIGAMTLAATRNVPGLLEIALLQRLHLQSGERYAIGTLARYAIGLAGVIWAASAIGLGWSQVQWLVAAIGLGVGFGLQEIIANFISGIILLFERPIRVGDAVTIGGISGTVSRIRIRATSITDWDRKELIVPNKEFITSQLVNWTRSDAILRVVVPVGVAYGSDTQLTVKTLLKVAEENPTVLAEPKPDVFFLKFGDSALHFELRAYCPSLDTYLKAIHELHMEVDRAFREAGIEIAFPQQDIHVRSIESALPIIPAGVPGQASQT